jgi:uncharacterized protein (TIGR03435 family)
MSDLAISFSELLGQTVIDVTGKKGAYRVRLKYSPDNADDTQPSIFAALQEQVGLKLEASRGPVEVLIVDRAGKPTGN